MRNERPSHLFSLRGQPEHRQRWRLLRLGVSGIGGGETLTDRHKTRGRMDTHDFKNDLAGWTKEERRMMSHSGQRISEDLVHLAKHKGTGPLHQGHRVHRRNEGETHSPPPGMRPDHPPEFYQRRGDGPTGQTHDRPSAYRIDGMSGRPVDEFKRSSSRNRRPTPPKGEVIGVYRTR